MHNGRIFGGNHAFSIFSAAFAAFAIVSIWSDTASAAPSQCDAVAGNLVANCGFEQGVGATVPGWTFTPAVVGSDFQLRNGAITHSGDNAVGFGATAGLDDEISQAIATIAGDSYSIEFWFHPSGNTPAHFQADFGSNTLLSLTNAPAHIDPLNDNFELEAFTDTATTSSTTLAFFGSNAPSFDQLDDVVVTDLGLNNAVPEPASLALFGAGLLGLGLMRRRNKNLA